MLRNLVTSLFEHGRVETTRAKAKAARPVAEKLVTLAKRGDLHARRQAAAYVRSPKVVQHLFEYWAGDDDLATPFNARIAAAIRALADSGTAVFFITGNRDLLAGPAFAKAIGATLLDDPACVRFGDSAAAPTLLLAHGDALCTDDLAYQAYRRQVRDPAWQAGFLAQPLAAESPEQEKVARSRKCAPWSG